MIFLIKKTIFLTKYSCSLSLSLILVDVDFIQLTKQFMSITMAFYVFLLQRSLSFLLQNTLMLLAMDQSSQKLSILCILMHFLKSILVFARLYLCSTLTYFIGQILGLCLNSFDTVTYYYFSFSFCWVFREQHLILNALLWMLFGLLVFITSNGFTYSKGLLLAVSLGLMVAKCFLVLECFWRNRLKSKLALELAIIFLQFWPKINCDVLEIFLSSWDSSFWIIFQKEQTLIIYMNNLESILLFVYQQTGKLQVHINIAHPQIRQNQSMQVQQKKPRISRIKLKNIAHPNQYKPVTERNNIFLRVNRNSAVLSRSQNVQNTFYQLIQAKQHNNHSSMGEMMTKRHSVNEIRQSSKSRRYSSANHNSIGSSSSLNKRLPNLMVRQTRKSVQLSVSSPKSNKTFDDAQNSSKNEIQGTQIGVLSTKEILKKYEIKKLTQEMNKKKFLDDYIQSLKQGDFENDEETDEPAVDHLTDSKPFISQHLSASSSRPQSKDKNLINSQEKLVHLLQNRVTDRDFIDFNVKLFEKRDINKKKFFQRYHNILKQQRKQIIKK